MLFKQIPRSRFTLPRVWPCQHLISKLVNQNFSKPSWKQSKNIFPLFKAISLNISFVFPYGLVTAGAIFFFSSPRLALRVKCRVRLAWLIKRLLCRLLYFYIPVSSQLQLRALFSRPEGVLVTRSSTVVYF